MADLLMFPPGFLIRSAGRYGLVVRCAMPWFEARKVSHAKVRGHALPRTGLSCCASSRRWLLAPSGFNPLSVKHRSAMPMASPADPAGHRVDAADAVSI